MGRIAAQLDLGKISTTLQSRVQTGSAAVGAGPDAVLDADTARRLVAGYRLVDEMLAQGIDPLAFGQSRLLLELNHMVLCGPSEQRRAEHVAHITATEARFYGDPIAGADSFYDWLDTVRFGSAEVFAALLYVRIVSSPQLFIEGNQRTAILCASFVLARAGRQPLVIGQNLAAAFAPVAAACRKVDRSLPFGVLQGWLAAFRLQRFIVRNGSGGFLLQDSPTTPAVD